MSAVWDSSDAGLVMDLHAINEEVTLYVNDVAVDTLDPGDLGRSVLLPLAPGDEVELIAEEGSHGLLVQKRVRYREAGDFIAYYTFEAGSGTTVVDRSSNDNDATINGGASWVEDDQGTGLAFDGSDDYLKVDQLNAKNVTDVEEFTVAATYRIDGGTGDIQQIVEHRNDTTNFEWFLETNSAAVPYAMNYSVWRDDGTKAGLNTTPMNAGDVHDVVGTYDGTTLRLYLDGNLVGTSTVDDTIEMGSLYVGADAVGAASQFLDGRLYQLRLYYTAFQDDEVDVLTKVMLAEAE